MGKRPRADDRLTSIASSIEELRNRTETTDVHNIIRNLARSPQASSEARVIAEQIIDSRENDWWVQGAIYALTDELNDASNVLDRLVPFLDANAWSEFSNSAIAAISAIGALLHKEQSGYIYRLLVDEIKKDIIRSEQRDDAFWPVHLESLVRALDRGLRGDEAILHPIKVRSASDVPEHLIKAGQERAVRVSH